MKISHIKNRKILLWVVILGLLLSICGCVNSDVNSGSDNSEQEESSMISDSESSDGFVSEVSSITNSTSSSKSSKPVSKNSKSSKSSVVKTEITMNFYLWRENNKHHMNRITDIAEDELGTPMVHTYENQEKTEALKNDPKTPKEIVQYLRENSEQYDISMCIYYDDSYDNKVSENTQESLKEYFETNTGLTVCIESFGNNGLMVHKPVIYLYPTKPMDISVKLNLKGVFDFTYPAYNNGWNVTAYPDGHIINKADGREYSYLFWDGYMDTEFDVSSGFVIKGKDTEAFLQEKLAYMGLTPKEYNEFIVYWVPLMQNNPYNLITFQKEAYTNAAPLVINPEPDSMLRVFMAYKPLDKPIDLPEQRLSAFKRTGFTVIEWGGCLLK